MPNSEHRLVLRELDADDAHGIGSWGLDDEFCRVAEWTNGLPLPELVAFQRQLIAVPPDDVIRLGAVWDEELVGYVVLQGGDRSCRELGYVIGPSSRWGMGFGSAVARLGLQYGFTHLGLRRIWAEARSTNHASIRVLEKIGMTPMAPVAGRADADQTERYERFEITSHHTTT